MITGPCCADGRVADGCDADAYDCDDHDDRTGKEDGEAGSKSECTQYQSIVELL